MMLNDNRISTIIQEEINDFLLRETVDFNQLKQLRNMLNSSVANMNKYTCQNQEVENFLYTLTYYSMQIIYAIDRCISSQNINEINLGDYGINVPQELGGNLWNNMKNKYYSTQRLLNRTFRRGYGNNNVQNANSVKRQKLVQTTVKSEKLLTLLSRVNQYQANLQTLASKYGLNQSNFTQEPQKILFQIIPNIVKNAQGTNP